LLSKKVNNLNSFFKNNFMAKYHSGYLAPFDSKPGTAIGSRRKNINYLHSRMSPSPGQQAQMARFTLVGRFIRSMSALFKTTFKDHAGDTTEHNYVFSYTIKNAITGNYPDLKLDYSNALVAQGNLPNVVDPSASNDGWGLIGWRWTDNSGEGTAMRKDKAILIAYCEELNRCEFKLPGTNRKAAKDFMQVFAFWGKPVQTWISFIAEDGNIATSIYTGAVDVY
jgi:hypothetical protein